MAQELNAFSQVAERGQVALLNGANLVLSAVIDSSETGTLKAGDAVELVATSTGCPKVKKLTSSGKPFGFVVFNAVQNDGIKAGQAVEVACTGAFMWMIAGSAINAGAEIEYTIASGKIATKASGSLAGMALEKASADGDLIRVMVKTI